MAQAMSMVLSVKVLCGAGSFLLRPWEGSLSSPSSEPQVRCTGSWKLGSAPQHSGICRLASAQGPHISTANEMVIAPNSM